MFAHSARVRRAGTIPRCGLEGGRGCIRATEILSSYENAPKLYRTDESRKRRKLSEAEYAVELADAREKTRFLCTQ
jgi:hypothetical protein